MSNFNSKNITVVGGSKGIGLALATHLHANGANVNVISRNIANELQAAGISHTSLDIVEASVEDIASHLPESLNGIVYCPGSITLKPFQRLRESDLRKDWEINLLGAFKVVQAAIPVLKKGAPASIVLFSTVAVQAGMNFHASIAAAKAAVEGFGKSLAAEFASANIRVNIIAPSITDTPLAAGLLNTDSKKEAASNRHPIKQVGEAGEIASLAAFLLSDQSSWITGQVIQVDGGLSSLRPL